MQSLQSIYSQDVWQKWKKTKLNLYTNKTSQLIKNKTKKKTTFSVYICGRKSVFTVQLYFSVATHLQENQHHLEIL